MQKETPQSSKKYKRLKTPTVIQMEAVECGAASLGIILGYYGKYVPLEELRLACGVTRDGSNALNIVKAAKSYGLEAHGYRKELEQLPDLPLPFIVHWGFMHFLVIEGFSKNYVYVNDPDAGPRKITYSELNTSFTGVALTFAPTPQFQKTPRPAFFSNLFWERAALMKRGIFLLFLFGMLNVVLQLSLAGFSQVFIDYLLEGQALDWKWPFLGGMAGVCLLLILLNSLRQQILNRFYLKLSLLFSTQFFWHIISLPLAFFAQRFSGEIAYRMTLNDSVALSLVRVLTDSFLNIVLAAIFGFALFYYDTLIGLVACSIVFFNAILIYFLYRSRQDAYAQYRQVVGKSNAYSIGGAQNIETLKATSSEPKFFSKWAGYYTRVLNSLQTMTQRDIAGGVLPVFFESVANLTVLMVGVWKIMEGQLTVGMLMAILLLMRQFTSPIFSLLGLLQSVQLLKVDSARLEDVLESPVDFVFGKKEVLTPPSSSSMKLEGYLDVKNLSFGFNPNAPPILHEINLSLSPGKSVALVGHSGCGKSTIAKLIAGLFEPWQGEILFDGTLRRDLPRVLITSSLAMVEQEIFLFSDTVKSNISLMETYPAQVDLIRAAKDACIHEDILRRKGGYDFILEANGANLSGGQRQRLQIARALYKNPSLLILDEATSALDSETEEEVIKNIRRRGCACLMVAHRLSTIKNCDEIIVISKGRIAQRGTHIELIQQAGLYKKLIEIEGFKTNAEAGLV